MIRILLPGSVAVVEARDPSGDGMLQPEEAACIERAVPKRRREFTAGRACAREALASFGVEDFPLVAGPDRAPVWPPGFVGSLTHCDGYCAAAVARRDDAGSLGIDVERLRPLEEPLVRRICSAEERRRLGDLPGLDGELGALAIFSAKESAYKCYYPLAGAVLEYADIEIRLGPEPGRFEAALTREALPAAGGARRFEGRIAVDGRYVYTAVLLPRIAPSVAAPDR
jgi:4'-phosphopantetheinyl transferase EntD